MEVDRETRSTENGSRYGNAFDRKWRKLGSSCVDWSKQLSRILRVLVYFGVNSNKSGQITVRGKNEVLRFFSLFNKCLLSHTWYRENVTAVELMRSWIDRQIDCLSIYISIYLCSLIYQHLKDYRPRSLLISRICDFGGYEQICKRVLYHG
jgi:hypothetical protein